MDQGFLLRAQRLLGQVRPARLDLDLLTAAIAARQAASPAARAQAGGPGRREPAADADALAELLLAGPDWRRAAASRRGCFTRPGSGPVSTPRKPVSP